MFYTRLVQQISCLEAKYLGNGTRSTHTVPRQAARFIMDRDNVQYFAVDSSQACPAGKLTNDLDAPVVVAIGANYSQGPIRLPNSSPSGQLKVWAYVEDAELRTMRGFLDSYFHLYQSGSLPTVWTTEEEHHIKLFPEFGQKTPSLPSDEAGLPADMTGSPTPPVPVAPSGSPPRGLYHLVAANFSPWITTEPWSTIRNKYPSHSAAILDYPPHGSRTFVEFDNLRELLPADTVWVGYGNHDVYALFKALVRHWTLPAWFFRGNLAFPFSPRTRKPASAKTPRGGKTSP